MPAKITTKEFIQRAHKIHGNKYNYSSTVYISRSYKVIITCPVHGPFLQQPENHLRGANCPACGHITRIANIKLSLDQFITTSNKIHNNKYNYTNITTLPNVHDQVKIVCPTHGRFVQTGYVHLYGSGCPKCKGDIIKHGKSNTTEFFIKTATSVHNNKYGYENVVYTNNRIHISITCSIHGTFFQRPADHLRGSGCPQCYNFTSKPESLWLEFNNVPNNKQSRQVCLYFNKKRFLVDGYCKKTNTIYEFWGDFWHGNLNRYKSTDINVICKKTFGDLHEKTQQKRQLILNAGYNLVEIWESDWNKIKKQLKKENK